MVLLFIYSFGLNVSINCLWDQSKPVAQQTKIINMHQSNGKHTSYYIDISLPPDTIELSVSSATYQRYKTSDSITYHINKGYLQTPWISIYEK
jgi:diphthamide biosynthesis methyltransferase